jgi:hypothetical protein
LSPQKTEELGFTRLAQPPDSPDLAPCDFFLFGHLKKELHRKKFRSQNGMISMVRVISTEIPIQSLSRVFDEWIERLDGCVANDKKYVEVNMQDLICCLCSFTKSGISQGLFDHAV